jgi:hypothetical protein
MIMMMMVRKGERIWLPISIILFIVVCSIVVSATAVSTTTTVVSVNNKSNGSGGYEGDGGDTLKKVFSPFLRPLIKHTTLYRELELGQADTYGIYEKDLMFYLSNQRHPIIFIPTFGGSILKNISNGTATGMTVDCQSPSVLFQATNDSTNRLSSPPLSKTTTNSLTNDDLMSSSSSKMTVITNSNPNDNRIPLVGNPRGKGGVGYGGEMNTTTAVSSPLLGTTIAAATAAPAGSLDLIYRESDGSFLTPTSSNTTTVATNITLGVIEDGRLCGAQMMSSENGGGLDGYYVDYLMEKLTTHLNYTPDYDLLVHSYDYRFVADKQQLSAQYERLKAMIEAVYEVTNSRVHLVAHGMGGVYTLGFLNSIVNQTWKDVHIEHFVTISTPFHGTRRALGVLISGESLTTTVDNNDSPSRAATTTTVAPVYRVEKNNGALIWMLPRPSDVGDEVTGSFNDTVTITDNGDEDGDAGEESGDDDTHRSPIVNLGKFGTFTSSVDDMKDLLMLMDESDYATIYEHHAERLWKLAELRYPNVSMSCIYGKGIATPFSYDYSIDVLVRREQANEVFMANGDGVATLDSLSACRHWMTSALEHQRYLQIHELTGPSYEHTSILNSRELFNILAYEAFPLL